MNFPNGPFYTHCSGEKEFLFIGYFGKNKCCKRNWKVDESYESISLITRRRFFFRCRLPFCHLFVLIIRFKIKQRNETSNTIEYKNCAFLSNKINKMYIWQDHA